jgi:hypothetical protein
MNASPRIHIITTNPEICSLIKKGLAEFDYLISCDSEETLNENPVTKFKESVDCLIIDNHISTGLKSKAKEIFSNSFVIYLPSLEIVENSSDGFASISAPLKLSELSEKLEDQFKLNKT